MEKMSEYVAEQWRYGDEQDSDFHVRDWRVNQVGAMIPIGDLQRLASPNDAIPAHELIFFYKREMIKQNQRR